MHSSFLNESILQKRKLQHTVEEEPKSSIACQIPSLLADYLATVQKKALPKLTELELEELRIDGRESIPLAH